MSITINAIDIEPLVCRAWNYYKLIQNEKFILPIGYFKLYHNARLIGGFIRS